MFGSVKCNILEFILFYVYQYITNITVVLSTPQLWSQTGGHIGHWASGPFNVRLSLSEVRIEHLEQRDLDDPAAPAKVDSQLGGLGHASVI